MRLRPSFPVLAAAAMVHLTAGPVARAQTSDGAESRPASRPDAAQNAVPLEALFGGAVLRVRIDVPKEELVKLEADPRAYVAARFTDEADGASRSVGVKLKGQAGSFRDWNDKPALTVRFDRTNRSGEFDGCVKLYFNNSVQDDSYLNEWLGAACMAAAGVPAPRVGHARLWLNGRDMGLYVVKEGFDERFLARWFERPRGSFYEGAFCSDIDENLELECGPDPADRKDLKSLVDAARLSDPDERRKALSTCLDIDAFLSFLAMECFIDHWDGYARNCNNYRIYFDPARGRRAVFVPTGMDQLFGDPNATILPDSVASVASAILSDPEWRAAYRERVKSVLWVFSPPDRILEWIDTEARRIQPAVRTLGRRAGARFDERVRELREQVRERAARLVVLAARREPKLLTFATGVPVKVEDGWVARCESDGRLSERAEDRARFLEIEATGPGACIASWRRSVLLTRGRYRFTARLDVTAVEPYSDEELKGAGIRISGGTRERRRVGNRRFTSLTYEFDVDGGPREVVLVAELRALQGRVRFEKEGFFLERLRN